MSSVLDPLLRGVAVGAFLLTALAVGRSELRRDARLATTPTCLSAAAWVLTDSPATWAALQRFPLLMVLAFPVAGLFWGFVATVFEDRRLTAATLAPAAGFAAAGAVIAQAPAAASAWIAAA